MIELKYRLFSFSDLDTKKGFMVEKSSFLAYIKSPEFIARLSGRTLYGANSHKPRSDYARLKKEGVLEAVGSQEDYLLSKGLVSNITTDLWVEDDEVLCKLLILDSAPGKIVQMLYSSDSDLSISMSIYSRIVGDKYRITRFNGVDFTTIPALGAKLVA